ncbi:MAG: FKBP-type peptidyl-prolyl cis-trans isomerase [Agathobacter sp.]|nr:FKBP-type peptidyl-prolyl cis-trans isomerase [Agathobacter sp.]
MKKKILAAVLCACTIMTFSACGGEKESTEVTEQQSKATSADYKLDYAKQVKKLCDYTSVPVELSSQYDITDEAVNDYFTGLISAYGSKAYHEVTDRTTVAADDYVDVDYTGYKDGEAFEGGAAEGVLIDVANNCQVGGSGFIEGFTAGLEGASVGDEIDCDVTFPEEYGNEDLAGQPVVFKFKINAIYDKNPVSISEIDDAFVNEVFGENTGVTTVEKLKEEINNDLEAKKKNAASVEIIEYIVENSEIEIPEDYLKLRLKEYVSYVVENYGATEEDAKNEGKDQLVEQIKQEIVLGYIAEKEGIKLDDDGYNDFITNYVAYYGSAMGQQFTQDKFYEIAGFGNAKVGENQMRNQYVGNLALDKLAENADIKFVDDTVDETEE